MLAEHGTPGSLEKAALKIIYEICKEFHTRSANLDLNSFRIRKTLESEALPAVEAIVQAQLRFLLLKNFGLLKKLICLSISIALALRE